LCWRHPNNSQSISSKLGAGLSIADILDACPQLTEAKLLAALTFAANYMQHETVAGFTRSMIRHEDFVGRMLTVSIGLQVAYQRVVDEWRPDGPPMTILFAAFGDRIAHDFDSYGVDTNREIFVLIEKSDEEWRPRADDGGGDGSHRSPGGAS
jgi:Protein of unknown function (DUF433)